MPALRSFNNVLSLAEHHRDRRIWAAQNTHFTEDHIEMRLPVCRLSLYLLLNIANLSGPFCFHAVINNNNKVLVFYTMFTRV